MRHRVSGSAVEQPVPRKISDDDDTAAAVAMPQARDLFGSGCITGSVLDCFESKEVWAPGLRHAGDAGEERRPGQIYFTFPAELLRGPLTCEEATRSSMRRCVSSLQPSCHATSLSTDFNKRTKSLSRS
jgi:hypothetical protein